MNEIHVGEIYTHYKGNTYRILAIGKHTETMEEMVVYSPIDEPNKVWVRPKSMWFDIIDKEKNITRLKRED